MSVAFLRKMAAPFDNLFTLPLKNDLSSLPHRESKVCIVSIFGKSRLNPFCSKATPLNPVIDKEIFQGPDFLRDEIKNGNIECYFAAHNKVLYMHLVSSYDINILAQKCAELDQDTNEQDFYTLCQDEDVKHAKTLLLLFSLSHIILLCHPGGTFDLTYLKLFHTLDHIRTKLQRGICDMLGKIPGVSKEWANFGRVCTPRMLFLFETPAIDVQPEDVDCGVTKSSRVLT